MSRTVRDFFYYVAFIQWRGECCLYFYKITQSKNGQSLPKVYLNLCERVVRDVCFQSKVFVMNITYAEVQPSAALQPYIDCYWLQQFTETAGQTSPVQRCPPFGTVELIIHLDDTCCDVLFEGQWQKLPRIFFAGMYRDSVLWRSPGNSRKFGIRMKPEALNALLNMPASKLYSDYTAVDNVGEGKFKDFALKISEKSGTFEEAVTLTEDFLKEILLNHGNYNSYFVKAANLMRSAKGGISIEEVSAKLAVSPRQLQRVFKEQLGTTPKTYGRIIRFSNVYKQIYSLDRNGGWAGISHDFGYADQAHFIREFKEFSGLIPNAMLHDNGQIFGKTNIAV